MNLLLIFKKKVSWILTHLGKDRVYSDQRCDFSDGQDGELKFLHPHVFSPLYIPTCLHFVSCMYVFIKFLLKYTFLSRKHCRWAVCKIHDIVWKLGENSAICCSYCIFDAHLSLLLPWRNFHLNVHIPLALESSQQHIRTGLFLHADILIWTGGKHF